MKLRNKKTGEIKDVRMSYREDSAPIVVSETTCDENGQSQAWPYDSLAELNENWEDYEEPKKYWFIDAFGNIVQNEITNHCGDEYTDMSNEYENQKQIGNYFETKEGAEKAAERLRALTRLKDNGFRFTGLKKIYQGRSGSLIDYTESPTYISFNKATEDFVSPTGNWVKENWDDLQLIFGGEE